MKTEEKKKLVGDLTFVGVELSPASREKLLKLLPESEQPWRKYADHMTIGVPSNLTVDMISWAVQNQATPEVSPYEEYNIELMVDMIATNYKVCAVRVKYAGIKEDGPKVPCANKVKHVTLGTRNDGKPVDSNFLNTWTPIPGGVIELEGRVKFWYKSGKKNINK